MVNAVQAFTSLVSQQNPLSKDNVDAIRKAGVALDKCGTVELEKLFDNAVSKQDGISLLFVFSAKLKRLKESFDVSRVISQADIVASMVAGYIIEGFYDKYVSSFNQFSSILLDRRVAIHGITILQRTVDALSRGSRGIITSLHASLFALCLSAKRLDPALDYLELDVGSVFLTSMNSLSLDCQSVLLYFYYGGLIYTALEDLHQASVFFEMCACLPAVSVSAIMIEALKKLILVNLLLGKRIQLPSYRSAPIQRASQPKCSLYYSIALLYQELTEKPLTKRLHKKSFLNFFEKYQADLEQDKNFGLAKKVYLHSLDIATAQLPQVFTKLHLRDVPKHARFEDDTVNATLVLENLIWKGKVVGKIDSKTETVNFDAEVSKKVDEELVEEAAKSSVELADLLYKCHRAVNVHPVYLARTSKKAPNAVNSSSAFGNGGFVAMEDEGVVAAALTS